MSMKRRQKVVRCIVSLGVALLVLVAQQVFAGPLPGAIFTTLEDGSRVNANIYEAMEDVYLDGGPPQNAPSGAAGLPEGDYYFQVTDPSGKVLLSLDPVKCRTFHVNANGVIDYVYPATCEEKIKGRLVDVDCTHLTGIDIDHSELGAITVQLMPYEKTPNKGGVYKVWATPVEMFVGDPEEVDNPDYFHGFVPAWSKTDNYKVRRGKPFTPPIIRVKKFDDSDADGVWDMNELEITGWFILVTDPLQVPGNYYTPVEIQAMPEGLWTLEEETPAGWLQTALYIDGNDQPVVSVAQVEVLGLSGEVHEVVFGNIELGNITACKFDDANANGINDDEPPVPGFPFQLDGINVRGDEVHLTANTGTDGCVTFADLLPGDYTLSEVLPFGMWTPTIDPCVIIVLAEGDDLSYSFGNIELGSITACKFNDLDANGVDDGEPPMAGILFKLDGTDVRGEEVHLAEYTGEDGCVTFADLLPGNYTLCEVLPPGNWLPTTEPCVEIVLCEGGILVYSFGNIELGSVTACKFNDLNANGINDGEPPMPGILFTLDGTNVRGEEVHLAEFTGEDGCVTFADLLPGNYTLCEVLPPGNWLVTTGGECVNVILPQGAELSFPFGNIELGSISACKFYDRNANGINDAEPPLAGILFKLDGINVRGDEVHLTAYTGEDGCVTFADLLPGQYTLTEVLPSGYTATTDTTVNIALAQGSNLNFEFGNKCEGVADFDTKGYWHNKNGLMETVQADFDYLNSLLPWQTPSSYFDAGDEPIDGLFEDGTPIPGAKNVAGETIAPAGTAWAEQSHFLVDKNATGDPREQLAQQLDAFIMNVRHRLDGDGAVQLPGGYVAASDLISQAIVIWASGTPAQQTTMSQLLDGLNNSDAVPFIPYNPCPVVYP